VVRYRKMLGVAIEVGLMCQSGRRGRIVKGRRGVIWQGVGGKIAGLVGIVNKRKAIILTGSNFTETGLGGLRRRVVGAGPMFHRGAKSMLGPWGGGREV